jgi:hypothetical protein
VETWGGLDVHHWPDMQHYDRIADCENCSGRQRIAWSTTG